VAIKTLQPRVAPDHAQELIARFRREADVLRELLHPNIIRFYAYFIEDDSHFIVMEYVGGGSLRRRIHDEGYRFSAEEACRIGLAVAGALGVAHHAGVIHRDIKPSNILSTEDGQVRLSDFGIARLKGGNGRPQDRDMTSWDAMPGTLSYMAPELLERGYRADERCDIWSLGIVLYEMLAGHVPFEAADHHDTMRLIRDLPLPPLSAEAPGIPPALEGIIAHMLEKDPAARFQSMWPVGAALDEVLRGLDNTGPAPLVSSLQRVLQAGRIGLAETGDRRGSTPAPFGQAGNGPYTTGYDHSRALLIVPGPYADPDIPARPDLVPGARELEAVLAERYGFETRLLAGPQATLAAIRAALVDLQDCTPDDRLVIYFAGAARSRRDRAGQVFSFLAAHDTRRAEWNSFLEIASLLDTRFIEAKHVFFVLDAPTPRPAEAVPPPTEALSIEQVMSRPALHLLCAGMDAMPHAGDFSLFTALLLDALSIDHGESVISADTVGRQVVDGWAEYSESAPPVYARLPGGDSGALLFDVPAAVYLPAEVLNAARSEHPNVRLWTVQILRDFALQPQPMVRRAAREQLTALAREDRVQSVKDAAQGVLDELTSTRTQPPGSRVR
jgi:hypothetical protein